MVVPALTSQQRKSVSWGEVETTLIPSRFDIPEGQEDSIVKVLELMKEGHKFFFNANVEEAKSPSKVDSADREKAVNYFKEASQIIDPMINSKENGDKLFLQDLYLNLHTLLAYSYMGFFSGGFFKQLDLLKNVEETQIDSMREDFLKKHPKFFEKTSKTIKQNMSS